jgi:hypothetical protein
LRNLPFAYCNPSLNYVLLIICPGEGKHPIDVKRPFGIHTINFLMV